MTYRTEVTAWRSFQPDVQLVIDPGGLEKSDALVIGVRSEVAF